MKAIKIVPVDDRKTKLLLANQAGEFLVEKDDGKTAPERDYVRPLVRSGFRGCQSGSREATGAPLASPPPSTLSIEMVENVKRVSPIPGHLAAELRQRNPNSL